MVFHVFLELNFYLKRNLFRRDLYIHYFIMFYSLHLKMHFLFFQLYSIILLSSDLYVLLATLFLGYVFLGLLPPLFTFSLEVHIPIFVVKTTFLLCMSLISLAFLSFLYYVIILRQNKYSQEIVKLYIYTFCKCLKKLQLR